MTEDIARRTEMIAKLAASPIVDEIATTTPRMTLTYIGGCYPCPLIEQQQRLANPNRPQKGNRPPWRDAHRPYIT